MDCVVGYILYIPFVVHIYMYICERSLNLQLESFNIRSFIAPVPLCTEVMKLKLPALQSTLAHLIDLPLHVNQ
jgi:hypothetical protein